MHTCRDSMTLECGACVHVRVFNSRVWMSRHRLHRDAKVKAKRRRAVRAATRAGSGTLSAVRIRSLSAPCWSLLPGHPDWKAEHVSVENRRSAARCVSEHATANGINDRRLEPETTFAEVPGALALDPLQIPWASRAGVALFAVVRRRRFCLFLRHSFSIRPDGPEIRSNPPQLCSISNHLCRNRQNISGTQAKLGITSMCAFSPYVVAASRGRCD